MGSQNKLPSFKQAFIFIVLGLYLKKDTTHHRQTQVQDGIRQPQKVTHTEGPSYVDLTLKHPSWIVWFTFNRNNKSCEITHCMHLFWNTKKADWWV